MPASPTDQYSFGLFFNHFNSRDGHWNIIPNYSGRSSKLPRGWTEPFLIRSILHNIDSSPYSYAPVTIFSSAGSGYGAQPGYPAAGSYQQPAGAAPGGYPQHGGAMYPQSAAAGGGGYPHPAGGNGGGYGSTAASGAGGSPTRMSARILNMLSTAVSLCDLLARSLAALNLPQNLPHVIPEVLLSSRSQQLSTSRRPAVQARPS